MEKDFIPYEEALALKELGFDEPCMSSRDINNGEGLVQLPLYQQAFRWFREKYKLYPHVEYVHNSDFFEWYVSHKRGVCKTYEEAELACLKKLIKLVKQKP